MRRRGKRMSIGRGARPFSGRCSDREIAALARARLGRRPPPRIGARLRWLLLAVMLQGAGCAAGAANLPAGDPERMSESEYDIARDLWLRQNDARAALSHALEAVELNEDNAEANHLVALLYLSFCTRTTDECRLGEAERYARAAVSAKQDFREAQNTLGVVLIHRRKYHDAIQVLRPLSQDILYPTPETAWGNLGWAYLELGQLDRAVDALRRSVAAQPLFCVGNYRLGLAHERKQQFELAVEALTRALETEDPRCKGLQEAYAARARAQLRLGRADQARPDLQRCVELDRRTQVAQECASIAQKLK